MPYYDVTPKSLFHSCLSTPGAGYEDPMVRARAWVEAENIYEVWKLVQEWFDLLESGEAANRYPDPLWKDEAYSDRAPISQEVADTLIEEMDADFMLEKSRFQGRLAPEFARLPLHARIAFVQEIYKVMKTSGQIEEEARQRLAAGETLPPL